MAFVKFKVTFVKWDYLVREGRVRLAVHSNEIFLVSDRIAEIKANSSLKLNELAWLIS